MGDMVELVPVSELDRDVFESWSKGKSLRSVSREFNLSLSEVERTIDRFLPAYDPPHSLRAFKREIERLESLASEVYSVALRDKNPELIHLYARLNERLCVMRNWGVAFTLRLDPVAAEATQQPSQHEKIRAALFRLAGRTPPPLADGNNGSGAADAPSPRDDTEPSR